MRQPRRVALDATNAPATFGEPRSGQAANGFDDLRNSGSRLAKAETSTTAASCSRAVTSENRSTTISIAAHRTEPAVTEQPVALCTVRRMLEADTPAPDFTLQNQDGEEVTLSSLKGKPVVLYFYPKADTPG